MIAPYPVIDPRRAKKLVAELEHLATVFVPALRGTAEKDSSSRALLEIGARLAGQVTQRLDKVPRRDALAFFHTLDVPQQAPQSARAALIFTLSDQREKPVFAAARIQVAGSSEDGEDVIFETRAALNLTAARLDYLVAVDSSADYIEEPPLQFFQLQPQISTIAYRTLAFVDANSPTLQVSPIIGLEAKDMIRIADQVYRLKEAQDGLLTLLDEDLLDQSVAADSDIFKVTRFDAFQQRNLQRHVVYIGHAEMLNLEQASSIRLAISPSNLASRLFNLGLSFELYGTQESTGLTGWHAFSQDNISVIAGDILLFKDWQGSVDEVEVNQQSNRWLRIRLNPPMNASDDTLARVSGIKLRVGSGQSSLADLSEASANACWCDDDDQDDDSQPPTDGTCIECSVDGNEGSDTITQAFHNTNPLALSTHFLPFGPEPLRFDSFALAAPEALSKKGAKVALAINLVDATLTTMSLMLTTTDKRRGYAVAVNGCLQRIDLLAGATGSEFDDWTELGFPDQAPTEQGSDNIEFLRLNPGATPQAAQINANEDLVVVTDRQQRLWLAIVVTNGQNNIDVQWQLLPEIADQIRVSDLILIPKILTTGSFPTLGVALFAVSNLGLHQLDFINPRTPGNQWAPITAPSTAEFSTPQQEQIIPRLITVNAADWPHSSLVTQVQIILVDVKGKAWLGLLGWINSQWQSPISWLQLPDNSGQRLFGYKIKPVAMQFDGNAVAVYAVKSDDSHLFGLQSTDTFPNTFSLISGLGSFQVAENTQLLSAPNYISLTTQRPLLLAFGETEIRFWQNSQETAIQYPSFYDASLNPVGLFVPGVLSSTIPNNPTVYINGPREKLYRIELTPDTLNLTFDLFDAVIYQINIQFDYLEVFDVTGNLLPLIDLNNKLAISESSFSAYALSRASGGLIENQKYNLYEITQQTYTGTVVADPSQTGSQNTSDILELDNNDLITDDKSILTFPSLSTAPYRVLGINTVNNQRQATLDSSAGNVGDVIAGYKVSPLRNQTHKQFKAEEIATLLKLGNQASVPPMPFSTLVFANNANPFAQLIRQRDQASPADPVWLLLQQPWLSSGIPSGNTATLFGLLSVGSWKQHSFAAIEPNPELSWEYFNGDGWRRLDLGFNDTTDHLATSGNICFCVPDDLTQTEIAGQEDYWIRARLVGGDYGRAKYVVNTTTPDPAIPANTEQSITVDNSEIRAPEIVAIKACFELNQAVQPQFVLIENNRAVQNQTQANATASAQFPLFQSAATIDPSFTAEQQGRALYMGFTKAFNVNPLSLLIDADESAVDDQQPNNIELIFEMLTSGQRWRKVAAQDQSGGFQHKGLLQIFIDAIPQRARLFGRDQFWLRVRPAKQPAQNQTGLWQPLLNGIYLNAAEAEHAKTVQQEILGSSSGEPDQRFFISKPPVVAHSLELRVREILSEDERLDLEQLAAERDAADDLLTVSSAQSARDVKPVIATYPEIPGIWVLWQQVDSFVGQHADARVYQFDAATGTVRFGNDQQGKIPAAGKNVIRAIEYQNGGGELGNVGAFTIEGLKSSIESVDSVTNPIAAAGGVDALTVDSLMSSAPERLRHRQQALTTLDIEALAVAWSSEIIRAHCQMPVQANDSIKVFIARRTGEPCPVASRVERKALARYLLQQGWGALDTQSILVLNPDYIQLKVTINVLASTAESIAVVEKQARERILNLLHPIEGGVDGTGWPFGRRVWNSDVFRALSNIPDLDRVANVELATLSAQTSLDTLPASALICVEDEQIKLSVQAVGLERAS